ncbi:hypothetical protein PT974_10571 [Cladobotryum mycophilum]|uniref:Aminoglycoside phosphotransferase domain-containing protein n=1 Tax=Cladobotryum mycophilum TaxID=491253 RepID=A0ABR0SA86_9HYPO
MPLRSIDENSWVLAEMVIIRRQWSKTELPASEYSFKGPDNAFYTCTEIQGPAPKTKALREDSHIRLIEDAGVRACRWQFGSVTCEVYYCREKGPKEWEVLNWLNEKGLSFDVPKVFYHYQDTVLPGRRVIVRTHVPGGLLLALWPKLNDKLKDVYTREVLRLTKELAQFTSSRLEGLDGEPSYDGEMFVKAPRGEDVNYDEVIKRCKWFGMKCDAFHFYNHDVGLHNIWFRTDEEAMAEIDRAVQDPTYVPKRRLIALQSYMFTGFVPLEWVATNLFEPLFRLPYKSEIEFKAKLKKEFELAGWPNVRDKWESQLDVKKKKREEEKEI